MKGHHWSARGSRQHNRAKLGNVAGPAWAVNAKSYGRPLLNFPAHAQHSAHSTVAARSTNLHETEFSDNAARIFPVKAIAAHHANLQVPPDVNRRKDAVMPERQNHRASRHACQAPFFERSCQTQRRPDQTDGQETGPRNQRDCEALPEAELRG